MSRRLSTIHHASLMLAGAFSSHWQQCFLGRTMSDERWKDFDRCQPAILTIYGLVPWHPRHLPTTLIGAALTRCLFGDGFLADKTKVASV